MSAPVYVQVRKQEEVLDAVDELKEQLLAAKKLLHELYDLRADENKRLQKVKQYVHEMQQGLIRVEEAFDE